MYLTKLAISNFRNIESLNIKPVPYFNLFYGLNAQGKTNLLESIYFIANLRSFRGARLPELIRHGEKESRISCEINSKTNFADLQIMFDSAGKKVLLHGKPLQRASDIHGTINTVMFSPDDVNMVKLGPEVRRRYLDRLVYTSAVSYLYHWHDYHKILKQRNALLKQSDTSVLSVWTEKLSISGANIIFQRTKYVEALNERLQNQYQIFSGNNESVSVIYHPDYVSALDIENIQSDLMKLFDLTLSSDLRYGNTTAGPHRDDLYFHLNGRSLKSFGSQGEQKSFVIALKLAELELMQTIFGESPLFLIDDMSSELDIERTNKLMDFISAATIQVFMTTTDKSVLSRTVGLDSSLIYKVEDGNLTFEGIY